MKKKVIALLIVACMSIMPVSTLAEEAAEGEESATKTEDEFDLSDEQEKISELGIPTVESVEELKKEADELFNAKNYKEAAGAYANYAKQANWLANIISGTLEPYYGASYDDRKSFSPKKMTYSDLSAAESTSNSYKTERNRAMLYEGLCYYYEEDYETALPLLIKALDLIDIEDEENWQLGFDTVASIVGYK